MTEAPTPPTVEAIEPTDAPQSDVSAEKGLATHPSPSSPKPLVTDSSEGLTGTPRRYLFFSIVASVVLLLDVGSKMWAEIRLSRPGPFEATVTVIENQLAFVLAYNKGGAWGLLRDAPDLVRRPFFLVVSLIAIGFILSLYRKLHPEQWALRWGLPIVLGGALGNLTDRITRVGVVDFIDYRAGWVEVMNRMISGLVGGWTVTDHWPTFNVADIGICVGVGLMALDVLFAKRRVGSPDISSAPPPSNAAPEV